MDAVSQVLLMYGLAILISLLVAVLIKGIVAASGRLRRPSESSTQAPAPPVEEPAQDDIAVIAAAVYAMMGAQRIVHIEGVGHSRTWTASSRAAHYASHQPRHKH